MVLFCLSAGESCSCTTRRLRGIRELERPAERSALRPFALWHEFFSGSASEMAVNRCVGLLCLVPTACRRLGAPLAHFLKFSRSLPGSPKQNSAQARSIPKTVTGPKPHQPGHGLSPLRPLVSEARSLRSGASLGKLLPLKHVAEAAGSPLFFPPTRATAFVQWPPFELPVTP